MHMYVTLTDIIQIVIAFCAIAALFYQISKMK